MVSQNEPRVSATIPFPTETITVTLEDGRSVEAKSRPDIHGVFCWGGTYDQPPRCWKVRRGDDDSIHYTEITVQMAQAPHTSILRVNALRRDDRQRIKKADASEPHDYRAQHAAELIEERTVPERADTARRRIRSPLQILHAKRQITGRQYSAGAALFDDYELSNGARQPIDLEVKQRERKAGSDMSFDDMRIAAGQVIFKVGSKLCDQSDMLWAVVEAVVLFGRTLTELAEEELTAADNRNAEAPKIRDRHRKKFLLALRCGLDIAGDVYGMPTEFTDMQVLVDGRPVIAEVCEDADGMWRSRKLGGVPWVAEALNSGEIYKMAKAEALRRKAVEPGDNNVQQ